MLSRNSFATGPYSFQRSWSFCNSAKATTIFSFSASFSAQIFTMPVSLLLFKSFAPGGIISSVIVSPIITFFIYSGIFLIILCLIFPFFSDFSAFFMKILYNLIEFLVLLFSKFKIISIN